MALAGAERKLMIDFIRKPLTVYLKSVMKSSFPDPKSTESCDLTMAAIQQSILDTIGAYPEGRKVLEQMALDILESEGTKHE